MKDTDNHRHTLAWHIDFFSRSLKVYIYIYVYGSIPINTIFSGLFTSINPSYFDVNYMGTIGFDTLPYIYIYIRSYVPSGELT